MARKLLAALVAVVVLLVVGVHAEQSQPSSHSELRGVLQNTKYDINAEFIDIDNDITTQHHRRLQNGSTPVQETTTCNTWCKLKESLGLTIVGLLLICLR